MYGNRLIPGECCYHLCERPPSYPCRSLQGVRQSLSRNQVSGQKPEQRCPARTVWVNNAYKLPLYLKTYVAQCLSPPYEKETPRSETKVSTAAPGVASAI
jgi:hypothetical protein